MRTLPACPFSSYKFPGQANAVQRLCSDSSRLSRILGWESLSLNPGSCVNAPPSGPRAAVWDGGWVSGQLQRRDWCKCEEIGCMDERTKKSKKWSYKKGRAALARPRGTAAARPSESAAATCHSDITLIWSQRAPPLISHMLTVGPLCVYRPTGSGRRHSILHMSWGVIRTDLRRSHMLTGRVWPVTKQAREDVLMLERSVSLEGALGVGQLVINLHTLLQISAAPGGIAALQTILNIMNRCVFTRWKKKSVYISCPLSL